MPRRNGLLWSLGLVLVVVVALTFESRLVQETVVSRSLEGFHNVSIVDSEANMQMQMELELIEMILASEQLERNKASLGGEKDENSITETSHHSPADARVNHPMKKPQAAKEKLDDRRDSKVAGHREKEHLPLLPWELDSIQNDRCRPPKGIPGSCCIRATNNGPGNVRFTPERCPNDPARYQYVQTKALEFLAAHPLPQQSETVATPCDVCRVLDVLVANNWTLSFVGDSLMRQSFAAFECELMRRGYKAQQRTHVKPFQDNSTMAGAKFMYRVFDKATLVIEKDTQSTTTTATPQSSSNQQQGLIQYFGMYRSNAAGMQQHVLGSTDILVLDHSLWYQKHQRGAFHRDMTATLTAIRDHPHPPKMTFWREQSAQHYDVPGGHWKQELEAKNCTPLRSPEHLYHHLKVMKQVTQELNITFASNLNGAPSSPSLLESPQSELYFIPFRNFTAHFHDIHPVECTHYCSTPYLWLPFWRALRLAIDQNV